MWKLARFLNPYRLSVGLVLAAVFFQALAELMLPNLMSQIVDEGIVLWEYRPDLASRWSHACGSTGGHGTCRWWKLP